MDLDELARTPEAFAAALHALGPARFTTAPSDGEWSPAEILLHVRAANAVIAPRVMQVLVRPGIALPGFDERAVGDQLARLRESPAAQVASLRQWRSELVALLAALDKAELARSGVHEDHGSITIADIAGFLADHEREHLGQLAAALRVLA